jgi:long-subunit acyl-CoA synthetase (AMP-forming)
MLERLQLMLTMCSHFSTGSAPISGDVLTFLRICFCCDILEGYGQTENAAGSTLTFPGDFITGQVGVPIACNEIRVRQNYHENHELLVVARGCS